MHACEVPTTTMAVLRRPKIGMQPFPPKVDAPKILVTRLAGPAGFVRSFVHSRLLNPQSS